MNARPSNSTSATTSPSMQPVSLPLQRKCGCESSGASCPRCGRLAQVPRRNAPQKRRVDAVDVVPPIVDDVLASPGRPLEPATRAFMESRVGSDLSRVRIHTDARAAVSARALSALAYTVGRDIVFSAEQYSPGSSSGRKLLSHELAHASVGNTSTGTLTLGRTDSPAEAVAERVATMLPVSPNDIANAHRDVSQGTRVVRRQPAHATTSAANFNGALSDQDYKRAASHLSEMSDGDIRTILEPLSSDLRNRLRNAALKLPAAEAARVASVIESLESKSAAAKPAGTKPGGEGSAKSDAADAAPPQYVSVGLSYEVVGMIGGAAPTGDLPKDMQASLGGMFGAGGSGASPIVLAAPGAGAKAGAPDVEPWLPGLVAAPGTGLPRFVDPIPGGAGSAGPDVYTRFIGPESAKGFFDPSRLRGNELAPRYSQPSVGSAADSARFNAFDLFKKEGGIEPSDLDALSKAIKSKGIAGLDASERALLQRITSVHGQVAGATPASPLLSLTEHPPDMALKRMPRVASERAYVVRVRIQTEDVGKVNEILKRAGQTTEGMAGELEVVVAKDLAGGKGAGAPKIISIVANPAKGAPLGGWVGPALKWGGRGLVFVGAALAAKDVLTAEGPHRRETQVRAFGSFAGGTALGAFAAGVCIGLAITGVGILLCGLGFGILGAIGGGAVGGAIGRQFD